MMSRASFGVRGGCCAAWRHSGDFLESSGFAAKLSVGCNPTFSVGFFRIIEDILSVPINQ
jgi:hypothetical protein